MKKFAIKILVNGVGLYVASILAKPHIKFTGTGFGLVWTVPLVTLGLFTFVINALILLLTAMDTDGWHTGDRGGFGVTAG